jgi:hypothetical protein
MASTPASGRKSPTPGGQKSNKAVGFTGNSFLGGGGNGYLTYEITPDNKTLTIHDVDNRKKNNTPGDKSGKPGQQPSSTIRRGLGAWHSYTVDKVAMVEPNSEFNVRHLSFILIEIITVFGCS